MARVRLPGGMLSAAQLATLARVSAAFGSGTLELTARGNVQIRGIRSGEAATALADALAQAGLLPSATHERVRNIVASPLSGRAGGRADVRGWVSELDAAMCAEPALASLPGRFWFGVDDGRGDVAGLGADVGVHVVDGGAALVVARRDTGVRLARPDVVPALVELAAKFVALRGNAWRITELDDLAVLLPGVEPGGAFPPVSTPPVGWISQDDGRTALGAVPPLGVLPARVAERLAAIGAPLVVTPWRSVLVCDLDEQTADAAVRELAPLGLVFDADSPWLSVSACTGSPGCAHSAADVRADAAAAARAGDAGAAGHRHFVGCERACGSPLLGEVLVAGAEGYRVLRAPA